MPGPTLSTDVVVLQNRPPTDSFQTLTVFSARHGGLLAMQRLPKKSVATTVVLDLFDEASLDLESSNPGQTWFVKDCRLLVRHSGLGRDYETLSRASALSALVARNAVPEESRQTVYTLIQQAFTAFAESDRPDIVYLKSLYRFARDEGYPVKQQWFPTLPSADHEAIALLLNRPLADQSTPPAVVTRLQRRLEEYLRRHTEILFE